MARQIGQYDGALGMFVEPARELDLDRLMFMRWLADFGLLEHDPAGPPSGPVAELGRREVGLWGGQEVTIDPRPYNDPSMHKEPEDLPW